MKVIRPRRTLEHLFGDDFVLPPGIVPFNPDGGRPRRPTVEYDTAAPTVAPPPPARPMTIPPDLMSSDLRVPEAPLGEPPPMARTPPPDYLGEDRARLRELQTAPVERSRLKSAGVGLARGGIIGAITGAFQPERYGEMKRDREIGRLEKQIGQDLVIEGAQRGQRREAIQDRLMESQITENAAQAARAGRDEAKYDWFPTDTDGDGIPDTETYQPLKPGGSRSVFKRAPSEKAPIFKPVKNADGSETMMQSDDNGATWRSREELGSAAPTEKPTPADFSGPLAAAKFKKASEYWALAQQKKQEAASMKFTMPDGKIDWDIEARQKQLLDEAEKLEQRTLELQEKGLELEVQSNSRPSRPSGQYIGQRISRSKLGEAAKRLGKSEAEAEAFLKLQGAVIY